MTQKQKSPEDMTRRELRLAIGKIETRRWLLSKRAEPYYEALREQEDR